jgi:hypothetical protein
MRYNIDGYEVPGGWQLRLFTDEWLREAAKSPSEAVQVDLYSAVKSEPEDEKRTLPPKVARSPFAAVIDPAAVTLQPGA